MPATLAAPAPPAAAGPAAKPNPAAKPSAAAAPKLEVKAPVESDDPFKDAFADIDQMDSGKKVAPKKEAAKDKDPSDVDGVTASSETTSTDTTSQDATSAKDATSDTNASSTERPVKAKELRDAYEGLKKKVKEEYEPKTKRLAELEAKVKEFESRDESTTKTTQERIAFVEKRNAELEQHMRFVDYEKSKEYQDQYHKPYEDAWANAVRELKGLTITIDDPNGGDPVKREVTPADLAYFANLDPAARRTEINRLFPEDKEEVKRHINQISHLAEKAHQAKEKAKADAQTHAKSQSEQVQESQKHRTKFWQESNKVLAEKYPHWFSKAEDDQEGNTIFDRGTALADLAFNPVDLTPERIAMLPKAFKEVIESGKPFSPDKLVRLHAIIRNKAANHDRLAHQNKIKDARIAELEKSLKEYEESSPDKVPAGGERKPADGILDYGAELEALERKFE